MHISKILVEIYVSIRDAIIKQMISTTEINVCLIISIFIFSFRLSRIIDLYKFTKSIEADDMYKDHVHFKDNISKKQAEYIYDNIKKYI